MTPRPGPVVALMAMLSATDEVRARLEAVAPGIELHDVPYREEHALRNARATGRVTAADRATAPSLSPEQWAVLERADAAVVLDLPDGLFERAERLRWVQTL